MRSLKDIQYIMIHHSATRDDGYALNYKAIRRYHMSYAYKGQIISREEANKIEKTGVKVKHPWRDIGYNFLVERVDNNFVVLVGRPLYWKAAACRDSDMNIRAIHICFIGNYDLIKPSNDMLKTGIERVIIPLIKTFNIDINNVVGHREYSRTSCPGANFSMRFFKK